MVSRQPRQIVGFDVVIDSGSISEKYCIDRYLGYIDIAYYGEHINNIKDTYTVERINADLSHHILVLA